FHQRLHGDRRRDVERLARVVAFAVPGRTGDEWIVIADAGLLVRLWDVVDVARHLEAILLENAGEIARRLLFLHSELAEAEDLIDHLLREGRHAVDHTRGVLLQRREAGIVRWKVDRKGDLRSRVGTLIAALRGADCGEREGSERGERSAGRRAPC